MPEVPDTPNFYGSPLHRPVAGDVADQPAGRRGPRSGAAATVRGTDKLLRPAPTWPRTVSNPVGRR